MDLRPRQIIVSCLLLTLVWAVACSATDGSAPTGSSAPPPTTAPEASTTESTVKEPDTTTTVRPIAPTTTEPVEGGSGMPLGTLIRYEEPELGFSFVYPEGWQVTESADVGHNVGSAPVKTVGAFDPTGNRDDEILLEGVVISVFDLGVAVNEELLPTFRAEVQERVSLLQAGLSQVAVLEPLRDTMVGSEPGFETTFTFTSKGRRLRTRLVFLVSDGLEYQLVSQAADAAYDTSRPQLDLVVDSFKPRVP